MPAKCINNFTFKVPLRITPIPTTLRLLCLLTHSRDYVVFVVNRWKGSTLKLDVLLCLKLNQAVTCLRHILYGKERKGQLSRDVLLLFFYLKGWYFDRSCCCCSCLIDCLSPCLLHLSVVLEESLAFDVLSGELHDLGKFWSDGFFRYLVIVFGIS